MISQSMTSCATLPDEMHLYKYRWVVLTVFILIALINFMQLLQFSIIANIVTKFYGVESFLVDLTGLIFFVCFIVFFYPVSFFIERHSLKLTVVISASLTLCGNLLKVFASNPDRFWLVILAQLLIAIGQVQIASLPAKLAMTWFGSDEVSTACALAVFGMQLGTALGCVQSTLIVTHKNDLDKVGSQLFDMFLYQAIVSGCVFLLVLGLFRSRPPLPPSQSQLNLISNGEDINASFFVNMKQIVRNRNFWFIVFSLGLANGVWNSFGILLNTMYLNYFPNGENDAGLIALIAIISGGCIGSMVFGVILDKTHRFKNVSFGVLVMSALTFSTVVVSLTEKSRIATFITIPLFGFFVAPVLIIGFEYLVEITYPVPEACSSSIFNASYYFISIVITLLADGLFDAIGYLWTFVVCFCIFAASAMVVLLIDSNLNRRDANLQLDRNNGENVSGNLRTRL